MCRCGSPPATGQGAQKMLKILIGLVLVLLLFVVLFFDRLKEALHAAGMAALLAIILSLSVAAGWLGFMDSGKSAKRAAPVPAGTAFPPAAGALSLIHISEPTRLLSISYAVFCLKKKKTIQAQQ